MIAAEICEVFNECFGHRFNTRLLGDADEPLYLPADSEHGQHTIYFRHDYAASALHEVAHWCIAGAERRRQEDFGYWYEGERDALRQRQFEKLEAKPQGLEWIFSVAAGLPFRVSCDNFDDGALQIETFKQQVRRAAHHWLQKGLPTRAGVFARALSSRSQTRDPFCPSFYKELPN